MVGRNSCDVSLARLERKLAGGGFGGIGAMEVTLTTPGALAAITRIRKEVPEIRIGAGTILSTQDASNAIGAGAEFIVTPTVRRSATLSIWYGAGPAYGVIGAASRQKWIGR